MKKGSKNRWFLTLTVAGMLALVFAGPALAKFPDRAITMVAPFAPGGTADLHARAIAPSLEKALGVPVTVLNKAGAGGALGTAYADEDRCGHQSKGDERILGDGSFVDAALAQAEKAWHGKYNLRAKGFDLEKVAKRVAEVLGMSREEVLEEGVSARAAGRGSR